MSIKKSQVSDSEDKLPLISERKQYPEVFRWKVAAIVITVLIAIFLTVDIILLVKYDQNQPRKINYTFMTDILNQKGATKIDFTKQQIVNMLSAFSVSFQELWYQSAQLISTWNDSLPLNDQTIANFFLGSNNDQLLTFFQFSNGTDAFQLATYTHIKFPLQGDKWKNFLSNPNNSYYTFEIQNKQSVIVGGGSLDFLKMSGGSSNLLNCTILNFTSSSINYLRGLTVDYRDNSSTLIMEPLEQVESTCFRNSPSPIDFKTKLTELVGQTSTQNISVSSVQMIVNSLQNMYFYE